MRNIESGVHRIIINNVKKKIMFAEIRSLFTVTFSHSWQSSQPAPYTKSCPCQILLSPSLLNPEPRASNEFKLEKQGYEQVTLYAGIWEIIPLILDLEAGLNLTIDSARPHKLLQF